MKPDLYILYLSVTAKNRCTAHNFVFWKGGAAQRSLKNPRFREANPLSRLFDFCNAAGRGAEPTILERVSGEVR